MTEATSTISVPEQTTRTRWQLAAVLMMTVFVGYLDRLNISLALPLISEEFGWDTAQKQYYGSLLMSLFYAGYGLANILISPFGARLGGRRSLVIIVILWSLFTAMGAWFSQILMLFLASRVLLGLAEGIHFPVMSALTKNWFPANERSRANGMWIAGLFLAILSAPILLVPLMDAFGWRVGFHVLAVVGLLVSLPLVLWFVYDTPEKHPRIAKTEKQFIQHGIALEKEPEQLENRGALIRLLATPAFLLMLLAGILNNTLALGISNWLPSYFASKSNVAYSDLTWIATIPYLSSLIGLSCWSWLGDKTGKRGRNAGLGFLVAGLFIFFAFHAESIWLGVTLFSLGVFFITAWNACEFPMIQHIFPSHITTHGTGIYNGFSTMIGGVLGTVVMSRLMADGEAQVDPLPLLGLFIITALVAAWIGKQRQY